jgi:hypothetical protein
MDVLAVCLCEWISSGCDDSTAALDGLCNFSPTTLIVFRCQSVSN